MKHLLYCIFLLVCPILYAQEVKVETNTKNIKIGEQIHYKISVENSNGNVVIFPEGQTFMPLEMVKARDTDTIRSIVAVNSGEELQALLTGGFQGFLDWRERAFTQLGLNSSGPESSPST